MRKKLEKVTYCKAGEDVRSCAHTDADHAADAAETPAVTEGPGRPPLLMHIHLLLVGERVEAGGTYFS